MALTQSARLPGPSWDEEVVPALRKRLESESRTLARRISGISLTSGDEVPPNQNYQPNTALSEKQIVNSTISFQQTGVHKLHTPQYHYPDPNMPKTTTPRVNGSESSSKLKFERTRTYSSPYASNGQALPNGNTRHKTNASKSTEPPRSSISRPSDVKPTRIPKVARGSSFSNGHSPRMNGHSHNLSLMTTPSQLQSPEITNQPFPEQRGPSRGVLATPPHRSTVEPSSRHVSPLLNESPPFTSVSTTSSFSQYDHEPQQTEDPPRRSIDSEERPYEHWYRGEVSRNGGVGELRVGRRQEMLDIANYGHAIRKKKKQATTPIPLVDEPRQHRKRADSIGGMTDKEREDRGSLFLDDEHANEVGRVLDESPLTDLDGEGSDVSSEAEYYDGPYAYIPEVEDNPTPMPEPWTPTPAIGEPQSLSPVSPSMIPRPSSRQQQQQSAPPTRIPALSSSRRSSESRRSATSPTPAPMIRGASEPPQLPSASQMASLPPPIPSSSNSRQQTYASNTLPTTAQKIAMSPASKKSRTNASKASKAKASATRKEQDANRKSVAYYPTPTGQGDGDMADAIPSWTQPVHGEGDWDEVVLPVVARKKGLDGHYENAHGSPQPRKVVNPVAPAPGTFGYDHSKYRPPRGDSEPMPVDEFGLQDGSQEEQEPSDEVPPTVHEEQKQPPSTLPAPFPRFNQPDKQRVAPFAEMSPKQQQPLDKEGANEVSGGCCKCIIM